jgi:hypothetical protein
VEGPKPSTFGSTLFVGLHLTLAMPLPCPSQVCSALQTGQAALQKALRTTTMAPGGPKGGRAGNKAAASK